MNKFIKVLCMVGFLAGCNAVYTGMSKSDLAIQTKMSSTIWLNPTVPENTYIYVQSRNTSDNFAFNDLGNDIKKSLMLKGYLITNDPSEANFVLQTNVLKAVMVSDIANADQASSSAMLTGAGVGFAVGTKNNNATAIGAGLLAGLASMYIDANTRDNYYAVQTDIRITEKSKGVNTKYYTTVLTVMANQVNLTPQSASAPIKEAIANSLAGLF